MGCEEMTDVVRDKEWGISDSLPGGFVNFINDYVNKKRNDNIPFHKIANELDVNSANLSRWLAGYGPLTTRDIHSLVIHISPLIYMLLDLPRKLGS
jgi:hypothetical protein